MILHHVPDNTVIVEVPATSSQDKSKQDIKVNEQKFSSLVQHDDSLPTRQRLPTSRENRLKCSLNHIPETHRKESC